MASIAHAAASLACNSCYAVDSQRGTISAFFAGGTHGNPTFSRLLFRAVNRGEHSPSSPATRHRRAQLVPRLDGDRLDCRVGLVPDRHPRHHAKGRILIGVRLPLILLALVVYFVPSILVAIRHHPERADGALNIFLGRALIGWIGALVWALPELLEEIAGQIRADLG